jgi:hypothetical protein
MSKRDTLKLIFGAVLGLIFLLFVTGLLAKFTEWLFKVLYPKG